MNKQIKPLLAIGGTTVIAVMIALQPFDAITLKGLALADLGALLLTMVFAATIIERSVEVYINNRYNEDEMTLERPIRLATIRLKNAETALDHEIERAEATSTTDDEDRTTSPSPVEKRRAEAEARREHLIRAQEANLKQIDELSTKKAAEAALISVILSLAAAGVGMRVFGQFLDGPATGAAASAPQLAAGSDQAVAFMTVDIVLTTLFLAGGADGMHQVLKPFLKKRDELIAAAKQT